MVDTVKAAREIVIAPGDTDPLAFIFEDAIPLNATISSPTIVVDLPGELTFDGEVPNSAEFNDQPKGRGKTVPVNTAILATPGGQAAGKDYAVKVTVTLSTGGKKEGFWTVKCRDLDAADLAK